MTDPAAAAVVKSSAPPLFQSGDAQRSQMTPDARASADKAQTDRMHEDAARKAGYSADGQPPPDRTGQASEGRSDQRRPEQPSSLAGAPKPMIKIDDDFEVSVERFKEVAIRLAEEQSGKFTAPTRPEDYRAELPKDFVLPADVPEIKFDEKDPELARARAWAQRRGLSQEAFSELLGIHAAARLDEQMKFKTAFDAEVQKLGPTGGQRMDAIATFLNGKIGVASAKALLTSIWTADAVRGYEKLMQIFVGQGVGGFSQANRDPGDGGKLTDEQYAKMSIGERFEYARSSSAR